MTTLLMTLGLLLGTAHASPQTGDKAPDFELVDTAGKTHKLSDQTGKTVVLEWFNPDCPFVRYAHDEGGPLATLANGAVDKGVVWFAINSGAPGKQGHGKERNAKAIEDWGLKHPVLLDEAGKVGKTYDAKTTPQMVIIDKTGTIAYQGALDNAPLGKLDGALQPFFADALKAVQADGAAKNGQTKPYGCSVKY